MVYQGLGLRVYGGVKWGSCILPLGTIIPETIVGVTKGNTRTLDPKP